MSENLWQMSEVGEMQLQGPPLLRYQAWYMRVGMASVYLEGDYGNYLRAKIFEDDGYTPTGRKVARDVSNAPQTIHFFPNVFFSSNFSFIFFSYYWQLKVPGIQSFVLEGVAIGLLGTRC